MPVTYRAARAEDLQQAGELVVHSLNELCERHGFDPIATVRPPIFSQFPGHQGRGIGRELLKLAFKHAINAKAAVRALITPAFNSVSQGLYVRRGLFPRCSIYSFSVERDDLIRRLSKEEELRWTQITNAPSHLDHLARIDACALGVSRAKHHRFLLNDGTSRGVMLYADDECVGYTYVAEGNIGPLAVTRKTLLRSAFRTALKLAIGGAAPQVSAFIPGPCEAALSLAIEHGMRIKVPMVLMSSSDFGNWAQYLPRNGGFM